MPTLQELRVKLPELEGLDDDHAVDLLQQVYYPKVDRALIAGKLGIKPAPPPVPERGMMRAAGDVGLSAMRGVGTGVRMLTDLAGADNAASGGLRTVDDFLRGLQSARANADEQEVGRIMKEAEGKGILDQVIAAGKAFGVAPVSMIANAAGTAVPTMAAAMVPGLGGAAVAGRIAGAGMGAAQGVGAVKGSIYDTVKQELLAAGASEQEAEQRAVAAQEYGSANAGQLALGGVGGVLAGSTGAERILASMRRPAAGAVPGVMRRALGGAVTEAVPEAVQGGQEKYATNSALINEGFDRSPWQGVAGGAALEGMAGAGMGAGFGAIRPRAAEQPAPPETPGDVLRQDKLPETGASTRALNAGIEAMAQEADAKLTRRQEAAPIAEALALMTPEAKQEALQALAVADNMQAPGSVRRRAQNRLDVLMAQVAPLPIETVDPQTGEILTAPPEAQAIDPLDVQPAPILPDASIPESVVAETVAQEPTQPPLDNTGAYEQREADRPPEPTEQALDTDIKSVTGNPFTSPRAAARALKEAGPGHELKHVVGGLVVRKTGAPDENAQPSPAGLVNGADASRSADGTGSDGNLDVLPDAPGGLRGLPDATGAVAGSAAAEPVGSASVADEALTVPTVPAADDVLTKAQAETPETGEKEPETAENTPVTTGAPESAIPPDDAAPADALVDHVTAKGKTIRGVWRAGLTSDEAIAIDTGTFKRDGKHFIRERSLAKLAAHDAAKMAGQAQKEEDTPFPRADDAEVQAARAAWAQSHTDANGQRLRRALGKEAAPAPLPDSPRARREQAIDRAAQTRVTPQLPPPLPEQAYTADATDPFTPPAAKATTTQEGASDESPQARQEDAQASADEEGAKPAVLTRGPQDSRGLREEDRALRKLDSSADELTWQMQNDVLEDDFDPADLLPALRKWAEDSGLAADDLRQAVVKRIGKSDLKPKDRRRLLAALDPTRAPAVEKKPSASEPAPTPTAAEAPALSPAPAANESPDALTMPAEHLDALAGKTITIDVQVGDTGKTATLTMDAADAVRDVRSRLEAAEQLRACVA